MMHSQVSAHGSYLQRFEETIALVNAVEIAQRGVASNLMQQFIMDPDQVGLVRLRQLRLAGRLHNMSSCLGVGVYVCMYAFMYELISCMHSWHRDAGTRASTPMTNVYASSCYGGHGSTPVNLAGRPRENTASRLDCLMHGQHLCMR